MQSRNFNYESGLPTIDPWDGSEIFITHQPGAHYVYKFETPQGNLYLHSDGRFRRSMPESLPSVDDAVNALKNYLANDEFVLRGAL